MLDSRSTYNFSAGPAMLPLPVLERAQSEWFNWQDSGVSILEIGHRGAFVQALIEKTSEDLRLLLAIPDGYAILFLPGGAQTQFAALPMNFLGDAQALDYVDSGIWAKKAILEAKKYARVNIVASNAAQASLSLVPFDEWDVNPDSAYLHFTSNETIEGLAYQTDPDFSVPIIADMSSNILSKPIDVSKYGVIYAGVQKNIAPAGLAIVIVRCDLLSRQKSAFLPSTLNYALQFKHNSCYNTLPVFQLYMAGLMFDWLKTAGGLSVIGHCNAKKARLLYEMIDGSDYYINQVDPLYRSTMNVVFRTKSPERDQAFCDAAQAAGLLNLKGHRLVGGMRASLYNAMPIEGVRALISFMHDFERYEA